MNAKRDGESSEIRRTARDGAVNIAVYRDDIFKSVFREDRQDNG